MQAVEISQKVKREEINQASHTNAYIGMAIWSYMGSKVEARHLLPFPEEKGQNATARRISVRTAQIVNQLIAAEKLPPRLIAALQEFDQDLERV